MYWMRFIQLRLYCKRKALCEFHCRVNPHDLNKAEVIWLSLHNFYTKLRLHLVFLKFSCSASLSLSSAQLCDQSVGPKQRPRLPPRLIRRLALRFWGGGGVTHWGLSIYLHLSTKTAPSWGWRSLYLTRFHPRMTHLSLDSLILISLFPFYTRLPLFDSPCLGEFGRSSCSRWDPHRLRQKQRDNPLCTVDTQTQHKKTPHLRKGTQKHTHQQNQTSKSLNTRRVASNTEKRIWWASQRFIFLPELW